MVSLHLADYSKPLNAIIGPAASETRNHTQSCHSALSSASYFTVSLDLTGEIIMVTYKYRHMLWEKNLPDMKSLPSNTSIAGGNITINFKKPHKSHKSMIPLCLTKQKSTDAHTSGKRLCAVNHFYSRSIFNLIEFEDYNWFLLMCKCWRLQCCQSSVNARWIFPGLNSL